MGSGIQHVDVAFIALWLFFGFFVGLVFYLRREDRREGYPLEEEATGKPFSPGAFIFLPKPKAFALAHGGVATAPNMRRDTRQIAARRTSVVPGAPLVPTGNAMIDGVGPGAWAERSKSPDVTHHGKPKIVPMRVATDFVIAKGDPDPRGMMVVGTDGVVAGTVSDLWIDRPESIVRYLEVRLAAGAQAVLLPMPMALINRDRRIVRVDAVTGAQFANVPRLSNPDQVTFYEEERIASYYGGGYLYATPDRAEPLL